MANFLVRRLIGTPAAASFIVLFEQNQRTIDGALTFVCPHQNPNSRQTNTNYQHLLGFG
jgi:hypothetical protein